MLQRGLVGWGVLQADACASSMQLAASSVYVRAGAHSLARVTPRPIRLAAGSAAHVPQEIPSGLGLVVAEDLGVRRASAQNASASSATSASSGTMRAMLAAWFEYLQRLQRLGQLRGVEPVRGAGCASCSERFRGLERG